MSSTSNVVTEVANNKVLPGDKTGLPWEIWQIILSWLSVVDLCHVSCVCKTWAELVISVDSTCWKELYLSCREWHHPFWPLNTQAEPPSWRFAYKDQYISTKFWCHRQKRETKNVTCSVLFKKNNFQKTFHVGANLEHESLRAALTAANDYDRIVIHPGIYDEQCEILAKVPFELIGCGELGSVILNVGVKQLSISTKMSCLVLRAPWFTNFIVNINSGYLQIDNCIVEDGMICSRNPSTVHIRFCTFRHASVILQHVNVSIIENCEFSQSGGANIIIEGHPKDEKNWAYSFLKNRMDAVYHHKNSLHRKKQSSQARSSLTSTIQSSFTGKSQTAGYSGQFFNTNSQNPVFSFNEAGGSSYNSSFPGSHYLSSDSLIGCRDIQHLYQDSDTGDLPVTKLVPPTITSTSVLAPVKITLPATPIPGAASTTKQHNNNDESQMFNLECSNRTLVCEEKELSQLNTSQNAKTTTDMLEKSLTHLNRIVNSNKNVRNNTVSNSAGSSSMQNVCGENYMNFAEDNNSITANNIEDKKLSESMLSSFNDQANSKHPEHSALKQNDHRKSVDSHVGFQFDEKVLTFQPVTDILQQYHKQQTTETVNSFVQSPSTETCNSKLPSIPKGLQSKVSNKRRHPVEYLQTAHLDQNHSNSPSNDYFKFAEINDENKPDIVNRLRDKLSEKHTTCVLKIDMRQNGQVHKGSFDLQETYEPVEDQSNKDNSFLQRPEDGSVPKCTILHSATTYQMPRNVSGSASHARNSNTEIISNSCVGSNILSASVNTDSNPNGLENKQMKSENYVESLQGRQVSGSGDSHAPIHCQLNYPVRRSQSDEILMESDDDLSILDEIDDSDDSNEIESASHEASSQTTDSSDVESIHFTDTEEDFSSGEESVIMLPHLSEFHINQLDKSTFPMEMNAETVSINSDCTRPVPLNILEDTLMSAYIEQIHGCLIHQCRMNHSKGGLMISLQAHAVISECDISNVGYGIRCIQNSRVVILKNKIHHCQTSGIFMRLAASGLIAGNDIHSNNEAGIDIRKSADPLVQFNQIHHGKRSGVVVLGSGHGQIKKNDIYSNSEAGVYVLYGGNPIISENHIYDGQAAGVAVNAGGKGYIVDNVIRGNHWSGIDIRNGSCSLVSGNSVINGISDGIVIGVDGKGSIENNLVSGNAGCGILMMAAKNLNIHGNQICNNGNCGVMMLDKKGCMTSSMENHLDQLLTDVNQRALSQCSDGLSFLEPSNDFALLQHNNIYYNKGEGILIEIDEEVKMFYNAIHANQRDGIHMAHNAPVVVEGNSITNNGGSGMVTSVYNKTSLIGNGIYDNAQHGIVCQNICVIKENDIVGHPVCAVLAQGNGLIEMLQNRLCSSNVVAVKGEELCEITAIGNKICDRGGGDFSCRGYLNVSENVVVWSNLHSVKPDGDEFSKTDFLTDPPQRPHIPPSPPFTTIPTHHAALVSRVTAPSSSTYKQGSRLCVIL